MLCKHRVILSVVSLLLVAGLVAACVPVPTPAPPAEEPATEAPAAAEPAEEAAGVEEVRVGILLPLTGGLSAIGENLQHAHDLAATEINEQGGIQSLGGAKLKLIYADTQGDPATGSKEAERLIAVENVAVLMGAFQSSVSYPSTEVAEQYKVPYVVPNSIMDEITERGFEYTFRLERKASLWGKDQIDFLRWLSDNYGEVAGKPIQTLALVYEDTDQGQSQAEGWRAFAEARGFDIVLDQSYPHEAADLTSVVLKIKDVKPDVVIFTSYISDAILMQQTLAEQRADTLAYLGSSSGHSFPAFVESVGDLANYLFDLTEWSPDLELPEGKAANERFNEEYGVDLNGGAAFCYAATWLLADALERARSTDPQAIRDALADTHLTEGPAMLIPWSPLEFDEEGQIEHTSMLVVQYRDQVRRTVWPPETASIEAVFPQPSCEERLK
jgi:branched-chain amino acid transport system substrate-binding protein